MTVGTAAAGMAALTANGKEAVEVSPHRPVGKAAVGMAAMTANGVEVRPRPVGKAAVGMAAMKANGVEAVEVSPHRPVGTAAVGMFEKKKCIAQLSRLSKDARGMTCWLNFQD